MPLHVGGFWFVSSPCAETLLNEYLLEQGGRATAGVLQTFHLSFPWKGAISLFHLLAGWCSFICVHARYWTNTCWNKVGEPQPASCKLSLPPGLPPLQLLGERIWSPAPCKGAKAVPFRGSRCPFMWVVEWSSPWGAMIRFQPLRRNVAQRIVLCLGRGAKPVPCFCPILFPLMLATNDPES